MKPIDPLQLQRLVDGELNDQQVQQLLAEAKSAPDQWQEIAVGFVENQTWSRAFAHREHDASVLPELDQAHPDSNNNLAPEKIETKPRGTNYSWLVMAASVMLAATIGYMFNEIQNRNLPGTEIANNAPSAPSPSMAENTTPSHRPDQVSPAQPQMTQADYHLEVPQEHLGELGSAGPVASVPLYAVNSAEQLKELDNQRKKPAISPEMLEQLTVSGYQMEQQVDYISGRLADGRSFVVPVRTIRFLPGQ